MELRQDKENDILLIFFKQEILVGDLLKTHIFDDEKINHEFYINYNKNSREVINIMIPAYDAFKDKVNEYYHQTVKDYIKQTLIRLNYI
jgi:hypothetical protein